MDHYHPRQYPQPTSSLLFRKCHHKEMTPKSHLGFLCRQPITNILPQQSVFTLRNALLTKGMERKHLTILVILSSIFGKLC